MKTSELMRTTQSTIIYGGKSYIRILLLKSNVEISDTSARRRCDLWLCIEDGVSLPTRPLIVPEVLS